MASIDFELSSLNPVCILYRTFNSWFSVAWETFESNFSAQIFMDLPCSIFQNTIERVN